MTAEVPRRQAYEPPELHSIGSVQGLTLGDDHRGTGFSGDSYAKKWARRGDYWHWYREHESEDDHRRHSR